MEKPKKPEMKSGIEIHQRLATEKKLFCSCNTSFAEKPNGSEIRRKLRAVTGETGSVDAAAAHEFSSSKNFVYKSYHEESCLIDTDSEPPGPVNPDALETVVEIALLLHCDVPAEIHVMRKNVIDGSNTSGFQRTAIVGINGWVDTGFGRVGIQSVALEEESSQIIEKSESRSVFGLNRLGIPLVEIATAPDIKTPEQGLELAEKLGMILRSSKVKRGLGTIRQDLNVSIPGGTRVEIKGVQDLKGIPLLIQKEAERQSALVTSGKKVANEVRKANPDGSSSFLRPLPGAARLYPETDCLPIGISSGYLDTIRKNLPQLLSEKRKELSKQLGIGEDMIKSLEKGNLLELMQTLSRFKKVKPQFTATILLSYVPEILKKHSGADPALVSEKDLVRIFEALEKGKIAKGAVLPILTDISSRKKLNFSKYKLEKMDIDSEVQALLKEKPGLSFGAYMGLLMGKLKGKVSGDEISQALKKALK